MKTRWLVWLGIGLGYAALCFALYWRLFVQRKMAGWDSIEEYWPDLIYQSQLISHGEIPLWNPYTVGGYAFFADPQASMLAPINLVCVVASVLMGTGPWLMELKLILLFYSALWGMHLLVHRWTKCHAAGFVAAVTFVVGSPVLVHKNGALLWPLLYLPWALLALDAFLARPSLRRGALVGIAVGATGAAGHPQGFEYAVFVLFAFGLYRIARALVAREHTIVQHVRALAPGLVLAAVIAGIWVWCTYGPASGIVEGSDRAQRTLDWVLANPLDTKSLRELFAPDLDSNWTFDLYVGPLAIILLAWRAAFAWEGRFWLAVAVGALVLALGVHAGVLPILAKHVPGFALFRIPYRYKLITGFACAVGAGLGVAHAMTVVSRAQKVTLAALCIGWVGAAAFFRVSLSLGLAVLVVAALLAMVLDHARRRKYAALLVVLAAVELVYAGDHKLAILQLVPAAKTGTEQLARLPGIDRDYRFWVGGRYSSSPGNIPFAAAYRAHVRELSGFEQPLTPSRVIALNAAAAKTPLLLQHFNVKYVYGAPVTSQNTDPVPNSAFFALRDVAPVLRVYPGAKRVPEDKQLALLAAVAPKDLGEALVDPAEPAPLPASSFVPVDGTVIAFSRNALTLEVTTPAAGVAVVNEVFAPGWHATVDGAPVELFRANYMLRGLVVPAGTHRIDLQFRAPGYEAALLALALLLGLSAVLSLMRPQGWDRVNVYMYSSDHELAARKIDEAG